MSEFSDFNQHLQTIVQTVLARNARGRTLPAFLHFHHRDGRDESLHVGMSAVPAERAELIGGAVASLVREMEPEIVGWTFEGARDDNDYAVVVVIDRERAEVWDAPLTHRDGQTFVGTFVPWPANQQAGSLITPIQEALR